MQGIQQLKTLTSDFFALHWKQELLGTPPDWHEPFPAARGGPYPNHDSQGCYALFNGAELRYIGVAIGRGSGLYKGHGIGSRIQHVITVDWDSRSPNGGRMYKVREKWSDISDITTIGFHHHGYLAAALECFLLTRLDPIRLINKNRPGAV